MKKIFVLFAVLFFSFSVEGMAQSRRYRAGTNNTYTDRFKFTTDMENRIKNYCPSVLKKASSKPEHLQSYCSVNDIVVGEADLGPWKKLVIACEKLFKQFRSLIYVAAVFFVLWLFVKAAYAGDMEWKHLGMLLIGIVILTFADVMLDIATNRVTIEDVVEDGIYVDCREKNSKEAFYRCSPDTSGAGLSDSRYFLQLSGEAPNSSPQLKGLF